MRPIGKDISASYYNSRRLLYDTFNGIGSGRGHHCTIESSLECGEAVSRLYTFLSSMVQVGRRHVYGRIMITPSIALTCFISFG